MIANHADAQPQDADVSEGELHARAHALVNPASGLANDYLNLFNEVVMLIEQLPQMPELMDDLIAWRPTTYVEYFNRSNLPGRETTLDIYNGLDARLRRKFEDVVAELDRVATGAVVSIRRHHRLKGANDNDMLMQMCERSGENLRGILKRAVEIVNYGQGEADEDAQRRADRLMRVRLAAAKDVDDFYKMPRFNTP